MATKYLIPCFVEYHPNNELKRKKNGRGKKENKSGIRATEFHCKKLELYGERQKVKKYSKVLQIFCV